jgi:hypothetical protein
MMHLNMDSAIQRSSRRFCTVYKSGKSDPLQSSERRDIPSTRPTVQSIIRPNDENIQSGPSSVSRNFELLQLTSVQTFQQHVRTPLNVGSSMGFLSKTQIWEDSYYRSEDVDSCPDARDTYRKIASIRSTIRTTCSTVRTREALTWKLRAARPSGRILIQERISVKFGKSIAQFSVWMPYVYRPDGA